MRIPRSKISFSFLMLAIGFVALGLSVWVSPNTAGAQLINVRTPFRTAGDSFFQRNAVNFGLTFPGNGRIVGLNPAGQLLPNVQLTQGSAFAAIPGQGGFDPNASLRTGFATVGGDLGISFGLELAQGSRRSLSSQAPSITLQNGQFGSISSGSFNPFVTSIRPVTGGGGLGVALQYRPGSAAYERLFKDPVEKPKSVEPRSYSRSDSSAQYGSLGVAELRRQRSEGERAADQALLVEVQSLRDQANSLIQQGNLGAARAKLGRAIRKVSDRTELAELRNEMQQRLSEIQRRR